MVIELPSDDSSPQDDSLFGGRNDLYEAYWLYVDGVRYTKAALDQSEATKEDTDRSPLACHFNHFYDKKEEYKKRCRDLSGTLPKYKERFKEPRGDVRRIPLEEFDEAGIDWKEGDDPIWLPPEYELPSTWEDTLENLSTEEMRGLIQKLREERDELQSQLETVNQTLSKYLENQSSEDRRDSSPDSGRTCENCGETFDSKAAKNGHKSHCDTRSSQESQTDSHSTSKPAGLKELAEELPAVTDRQTTTSHEALSAEEELKNLNHLLTGSL